MTRKRRKPEQIIKALREADTLLTEGNTVAEACKILQVSEQTYYNWRRKYGDMQKSEVKRLKELEEENDRLKRIVAELSIDKAIMEEFIKGKY